MINTKRIFTALLLAVIAMAGYAYDFEVDGIYYCYDVYGNAVVTHGNKKYTGKIKIPSEVKWNGKKKKVVEIGDYAFECCYELKSVSIPSSVYYIGRFAFSCCLHWCNVHFLHRKKIEFLPNSREKPIVTCHQKRQSHDCRY